MVQARRAHPHSRPAVAGGGLRSVSHLECRGGIIRRDARGSDGQHPLTLLLRGALPTGRDDCLSNMCSILPQRHAGRKRANDPGVDGGFCQAELVQHSPSDHSRHMSSAAAVRDEVVAMRNRDRTFSRVASMTTALSMGPCAPTTTPWKDHPRCSA
jgi:hypothetical protein